MNSIRLIHQFLVVLISIRYFHWFFWIALIYGKIFDSHYLIVLNNALLCRKWWKFHSISQTLTIFNNLLRYNYSLKVLTNGYLGQGDQESGSTFKIYHSLMKSTNLLSTSLVQSCCNWVCIFFPRLQMHFETIFRRLDRKLYKGLSIYYVIKSLVFLDPTTHPCNQTLLPYPRI